MEATTLEFYEDLGSLVECFWQLGCKLIKTVSYIVLNIFYGKTSKAETYN